MSWRCTDRLRETAVRSGRRGPGIWGIALVLALTATAPVRPVPEAAAAAGEMAAARPALSVRLMTQSQYQNTIAALFGEDIAPTMRFSPLPRSDGLLAVGASKVGVSAADAEGFHRVAYEIAEKIIDPEHRAVLVSCAPRDPAKRDEGCARAFITRVGRLLFRQPLSPADADSLVADANGAADRFGSFYSGLSFSLAGMLASPQFLFVADRVEPDPARPGESRLTGYALATRLSILLWDSMPDEALLAAAERGELGSDESLARWVDAMIASPRFETGVRAFFTDALALEDFNNLSKDPVIYPTFSQRSAEDAREQILRMVVDNVVVRDADYRELFTTRSTFITPALALIYGMAAPASGWSPLQTAANGERQGILTQVGFLAAHAHPGRSSPTRRGRAVRELLFCQPVPNPPPNVDFSNFENDKAHSPTARDRLTAHSSDPVCAGCHKITDPIGLALENFDGSGQFRRTENGAVIDATGRLDGKDFTDPKGLSAAVAENPALTSCLVQRALAYGLGRSMNARDGSVLTGLETRFASDRYRVSALMRALATHPAFTRAPGTPTGVGSGAVALRPGLSR